MVKGRGKGWTEVVREAGFTIKLKEGEVRRREWIILILKPKREAHSSLPTHSGWD